MNATVSVPVPLLPRIHINFRMDPDVVEYAMKVNPSGPIPKNQCRVTG